MGALKLLNVAIRFSLELCLLAAVGYWGFKSQPSWLMKILFGIGLPVLIAMLWGMFIAPKAIHPLSGVAYLVVELTLLVLGSVALFASGKPGLGWVYTITLSVNKVLLVLWKQ